MASSLFPVTRWSLIGRIDDRRVLAQVVEHYAEAVALYLERKFPSLGRQHLIDDVVQEVLLALMRRPELLQRAAPGSGSRFRYFLMRVAYNAARNARRGLQRREWTLLADEAVDGCRDLDVAVLPDQDMDRAWAMGVLRGALGELRAWGAQGRLEPDAVEILERNLLRGEPIREAAQAMGLSLGTAHRRLAKARTMLRGAVVERLRYAGEAPADAQERAYEVLVDAVSG